MSPCLGALNNTAFAIPFEIRVSIFRHFVASDMVSHVVSKHRRSGRTRVSVRRGSVAQDGFDKLEGADLKAPIEISFINQFGQEE
jgi:ubiquitin-protein ligase E3 C